MRHHAPKSLAVAAVVLFTACASLLPYDPPEITLVGFGIEDVALLETTATVTFRLINENRKPLVVDGATFNVYLDGIKVGKALTNERLEVPQLGTATQEATLYLSNAAIASRVRSMLSSRSLSYRLKGKVWLRQNVGTRKLRFDSDGVLDLGGGSR